MLIISTVQGGVLSSMHLSEYLEVIVQLTMRDGSMAKRIIVTVDWSIIHIERRKEFCISVFLLWARG